MRSELSLAERSRRTFVYDSVRCFFTGILEGWFKTFALLIAIRVFNASSVCKAIISSAGFASLLFAPITVHLASKLTRVSATKICMSFFILVFLPLLISAFTHSFWTYFILMVMARVIFKQYIPIMVDVYGHNYSRNERGHKLSYALMILPFATIIFSPIGGFILDSGLENYRIILIITSLAAAGAAYSFHKIPSRPIPKQKEDSLWENFKIIVKDRLFFTMLILLMLTGVATQMTMPLRMEYLANEKYGINSSNFFVTLVVTTIPYICRMASSVFWGKLFDRLSIIQMRVAVNLFLLLGFVLFFNSKNAAVLSVSAVFTGLGYGGGEIVWCLWITKIIDKDKFSQYMSANTAFVGVRSFVSQFIGYALLGCGCSFSCVGNIATALVLVSIAGCFFIRKHARFSAIYD